MSYIPHQTKSLSVVHVTSTPQRKYTIYEALCIKLSRVPTNAELKADVERIKATALIELAAKGKLKYQRRTAL
jgi:hypothetical protein